MAHSHPSSYPRNRRIVGSARGERHTVDATISLSWEIRVPKRETAQRKMKMQKI
jgi:hypothetical protein